MTIGREITFISTERRRTRALTFSLSRPRCVDCILLNSRRHLAVFVHIASFKLPTIRTLCVMWRWCGMNNRQLCVDFMTRSWYYSLHQRRANIYMEFHFQVLFELLLEKKKWSWNTSCSTLVPTSRRKIGSEIDNVSTAPYKNLIDDTTVWSRVSISYK